MDYIHLLKDNDQTAVKYIRSGYANTNTTQKGG